MSDDWTDRITGARMHVDQQFQSRVQQSEFSNQQWGLVMTAVEFRIENPDDPASATLVADTDNIEQILPEIEKIPRGVGTQPSRNGSPRSGLLETLRGLLSIGGSDGDRIDEEKLASATALAEEYASELQTFLEKEGRWSDICAVAADTVDSNE